MVKQINVWIDESLAEYGCIETLSVNRGFQIFTSVSSHSYTKVSQAEIQGH